MHLQCLYRPFTGVLIVYVMSPQSGRYGAPLKGEQARRCIKLVVDDFESLLYSCNTMQGNDTRRKEIPPRILPYKWPLVAAL